MAHKLHHKKKLLYIIHLICIQEIAKLWNSFNPKNGKVILLKQKLLRIMWCVADILHFTECES